MYDETAIKWDDPHHVSMLLPSGQRLHFALEIHNFYIISQPTMSMAMFNSFLYVYQGVIVFVS